MLKKVKALLKEAETRETFFKRIDSFLTSVDPRYKAIEKAYDAAEEAFKDKERANGDRYFEHLRAVAIIVIDYLRIKDPVVIITALLHDIVEDTPWTIERIKAEFGDEVALLMSYVTKPSPKEVPSPEERKKIYHSRQKNAPRKSWFVKLADRLHNMLTIWVLPPEKIIKKIEETKRYYLPYAEKEIILIHELEAAIKELEKSKKILPKKPLG